MKKLLILIVLAAMMLTACQSTTLPTNTDNEQLEATTTEPTAETQKQTPEAAAAEDPATETAEETAAPTDAPETTKATEKPTEAVEPLDAPKPTETQAPTAPHTHSYTASVTAPTCTAQGYTTHTCSCGDSYKDSYTNALGHSYADTVVPATETEQGYTKHTCSACGDSYIDSYTPVQRVEIITEADIQAICVEACAYAESLGLRVDPTAASWTASCCCSRYSGGYMTREEGLAYIRRTFFEDAEYYLYMGYAAYYPLYWASGDDWRFVGAFSFS